MSKNKEAFHELYIELTKCQNEIIRKGIKVVLVFEGRDAAGKDGMIRTLTKYLSPREIRIAALPKPSEREKNEWYFQRYVSHFPANGEIVFFNRSWYNRLGVEKVMGFCSNVEYEDFFQQVKNFEKTLVHSGITIIKYYLNIDKEEQRERLHERKINPLKQWKISPIDKVALKLWDEYSDARDVMLQRTNFQFSPWFVVDANDKKKAQLAMMNHLVSLMNYKNKVHVPSQEKLVVPAHEIVYAKKVKKKK